jgi:hypothetical protein
MAAVFLRARDQRGVEVWSMSCARGDVVRVVHLSRVGNDWSGGSTMSRTAAEKNLDGERR